MNSHIKSGFVGLALVALTASGVLAQYPGGPMDDGGAAIRRQQQLWDYGIRSSDAAGWAYYQMLQQRRAMGLPVPEGPPLGYRRPQNCGPVWDPIYGRYNILCQ
jgi:hypothetical protein